MFPVLSSGRATVGGWRWRDGALGGESIAASCRSRPSLAMPPSIGITRALPRPTGHDELPTVLNPLEVVTEMLAKSSNAHLVHDVTFAALIWPWGNAG